MFIQSGAQCDVLKVFVLFYQEEILKRFIRLLKLRFTELLNYFWLRLCKALFKNQTTSRYFCVASNK